MSVTRYITINDVVNRVAVETGLDPTVDVFAASDPAFTQLSYLLTACVQELLEMYPWQILVRRYEYTTTGSEEGVLAIPSDFAYMIPQTGWDQSNRLPLGGPLSAQQWTYLQGRDLAQNTIYVSLRFEQNRIRLYPDAPTPAGVELSFEYISRNLIQIAATDPQEYTDEATAAGDIVLFPPNVITRMLKMKFLDAKGFNTTKATDDFYRALQSWQGKDNSAGIVSVSGRSGGIRYLNGFTNTPDTGFGS